MIHAAPAQLRRTQPPIRRIVLFGVAVSQIPLWYAPSSARSSVLWLVSIALSVVCAWLVPRPRRWLVGLGSILSLLSVLFIDVRQNELFWGFVIAPLLSVVMLHSYLTLSRWAVPIPEASAHPRQDSLPNPQIARRWRWFLTILIAFHALGLALYWAYTDHQCSWLDLTRRVQGCALVQTLPAFSEDTYEVQLAQSGALAASAAGESVPPPSPLNDQNFEAFRQQLATQATTISLWDLRTGRLLRTLEQPTHAHSITFSPNDQLVATSGADDQTRIWKVDDGSLQHTIPNAYVRIFSPDASLVATATDDQHVRLWSLRDGRVVRTITLPEQVGAGVEMLFSPDGTLLAVRDYSDVTLWRVHDGTLHQTLATDQIPSSITPSLSFSPDGNTLAMTGRWLGEDERSGVLLWRVADGTLLNTLNVNPALTEKPFPANIHSVDFSPDGARLVAGVNRWSYHSNVALIWRVADGALLEQIEPVVTNELIRFSDDGTSLRLYHSSRYDTARVYTQRMAQTAAE